LRRWIVKAATKSFLALTASDLMTAPVMTIPQEMSLREAACLFSQSHISGAPVVSADGQCLGVLSSSDFVTWVVKGGDTGEKGKAVAFIAPWGEWISIDNSPDDNIGRYMSAKPITVVPSTPLGELAQKMVEAHIHRVPVIEHNRPCGIVTSTDVLAAVARTARRVSQKAARPNS
jgi:CBS domain-containing protein